ncbi:hypothetical protein BDN72DRAFT_778841 [Pluteus cervinus]|uniref:Uncharacterized protein n=1 Tax=Pluteus cervinus TaxID=181527 RepID=A0ACD3A6H3_9AGAR|nr:hypothetical protein BDN72DRAFT_778841 [Pluteus cervinus]
MFCPSFLLLIFNSKPLIIADKEGRALVIFVGGPHNDSSWKEVVRRAQETMASVRLEGLEADALPLSVQSHRRGEFVALPVGVSHGNGRLQPGNLIQPLERQKLVDRLLSDPSIQRIAGYQSSLFSYYAPKLYAHFCLRLHRLFDHDKSLIGNFVNSVFPATSFNLGPRTVSLDHTDAGNVGYGLCALVSLGTFDSRKGGHLVLFDLGLMVPFPSSSVALLPSGILRHGNTTIQAGEERYSIAQYCAGGLFRWVEYGYKAATALTGRKSKAKTKKSVLTTLYGTHEERVEGALGLFSTVDALASDRVSTFRGFASWLRPKKR